VGSGMVVKVADFGLSRSSKISGSDGDEGGAEYYRSTSGVLPVRWSAPEAMENQMFTQASDVWSFGIVMVELMQDGAGEEYYPILPGFPRSLARELCRIALPSLMSGFAAIRHRPLGV
jgi:serine/threonine protein kinase